MTYDHIHKKDDIFPYEFENPVQRSITELETLTGRKKSNLSRTLKTLERYGIVRLKKEKNRIVPESLATDFVVEMRVAQYL